MHISLHMEAGLERFTIAQQQNYTTALEEIKNGKKEAIGCGIFFRSSKV
jgi:uncharacterized protein (DUF1810 family)